MYPLAQISACLGDVVLVTAIELLNEYTQLHYPQFHGSAY